MMTTAEYVARLREERPQPDSAPGAFAAPGAGTRPMRVHRSFAAVFGETGSLSHSRGAFADNALETPPCLLAPLL